jgi:hypothetical protein
MEQLSLRDASWNGLPQDVRTAIRDDLKTQEGGCSEARRQCAQPVDKEHLAWCTENRRWLRTCDLLEVHLDDSKLTYPPSQFRSEELRQTRMRADREMIRLREGTLSVPTTQWGALNHRLLDSDEVSVLQLTRADNVQGVAGHWYTSATAPDYVFWMRVFSVHVLDLINDERVNESGFMVYAVKRAPGV